MMICFFGAVNTFNNNYLCFDFAFFAKLKNNLSSRLTFALPIICIIFFIDLEKMLVQLNDLLRFVIYLQVIYVITYTHLIRI